MSKLLIEESPLTFQPSLAVAIGINEAIVLQQIHYWISNTKNKGYEQDGYKWVYNTYAEWKETNFPFWSENTIQRVFASLEEKGLVVSIQPMKGKYDRTKYYRVEYTKLEVFEDTKSVPLDDPKLVSSLNESEITTEIKADKPDLIDSLLEMSNFSGAKREARIASIQSYFGERFRINAEAKKWRDFARYVDDRQQNFGEDVKVFVSWLYGQKGFDLAYWPPSKMQEFWPSAFVKEKNNIGMFETLS